LLGNHEDDAPLCEALQQALAVKSQDVIPG